MNLQDIEDKYQQEMSDMEDAYIGLLESRIKELEVENVRITDAYKELITKLNAEDRSDITITP